MILAVGGIAAFICVYLVVGEVERIRRVRRDVAAIGAGPSPVAPAGVFARPTRLWRSTLSGELPLRTIQVALAVAAAAFLAGAVLRSFTLVAAGALLGIVALYAFGQRRRWTLDARVDQQLPEAMTTMANALSAGATLFQALATAANESPAPLGALLHAAVARCEVNQTVDESLDQLQRETGSRDVHSLVAALMIQRNAGGNLAGLLREAAAFMREEQRLRADARALSAQSRYSSQLIGFMPPGLFLLFLAFFPSYIAPLTDTVFGNLILAYAALSTMAGYYVISRIAARIERA